MGESILRGREAPFECAHFFLWRRSPKGKPVNIPAPGCRCFHGNVTARGDAGRSPGKSSLFFLTAYHPEIGLSGARVPWLVEPRTLAGSRALLTARENPRKDSYLLDGSILRQVVLITAAGPQGEQPLVDRTM